MIDIIPTKEIGKNDHPFPRKGGLIRLSTIIILAFFSAFYPRVLEALGFPSVVNFFHFITVPIAFILVLTKTRIKDKAQLNTISLLLSLLAAFLCCILISSLLNSAGIINGALSFLLWGEPFLLLISILCLPTQERIVNMLRKGIVFSLIIHSSLAYIQYYILGLYRLRGAQDNIQGVFYRSGAGHVVGSSVALIISVYFLCSFQKVKWHYRVLPLILSLWHMILADAKQVLVSLVMGAILLIVVNLKSVLKTIGYLLSGSLLSWSFLWCIQNLDSFRAFKTWTRSDIYGPDGEAILLKLSTFRIVPGFYESPLNWLFGLGPGHTVDRLGGWMLKLYAHLLLPLGATVHPASNKVWEAVSHSWLGNQSSFFSPLFGWAALWGDFGFVGLIAYVAIGLAIYSNVCSNDFSRFTLFTVIAIGFIFSQMQEPGYMLTVALLIGVSWHEQKLKSFHSKLSRERCTNPG